MLPCSVGISPEEAEAPYFPCRDPHKLTHSTTWFRHAGTAGGMLAVTITVALRQVFHHPASQSIYLLVCVPDD